MTTMGSDYFPKTPEGRMLCFLLAIYASAIFGYLTATLATFFVGQDANDVTDDGIASEKSVRTACCLRQQSLLAEIIALRQEIRSRLEG